MSYTCGLSFTVAHLIGLVPCEPHITCDGCGMVRYVAKANGMAPAWFLDGKAAPGWKNRRVEDTRFDYCPKCPDPAVAFGTREA